MDKQEFLLLIPGIIYGVAIVDLLKIVQHKVNYWEVVYWGVLLMVMIINHWMDLYQQLDAIEDSNLNFYLIIVQAMIYAKAANIITPTEKDTDTRGYFFRTRKNFFLTVLGAVVFNILIEFVVFDDHLLWIRISAIPLLMACAYIDQIWVRFTIGIYYIGLTIKLVFLQNTPL